MRVYKLCWNMMIHSWSVIVVYLVVFLGFVILVDKNLFSNAGEQEAMVSVLLINEDEDSILAKQFVKFLGRYVNCSNERIESDSQLKNDMFYDEFECVIRIPSSFTKDFMEGKPVEITRYHYIESNDTVMVEMLINQFLTVLSQYQDQNRTLEQIIFLTVNQLLDEVPTSYEGSESSENERFGTYANYMAFIMMSIILYYTAFILFSLRKEQIRKRNMIAPIHSNMIYKEVALATCTMAELITIVLAVFGIWLTGSDWREPAVILICFNTVLYAGFCVSVAFILGMIIKSLKRLEIIEQLIVFGGSFVSGVFVTQSMLPKEILTIAGFLPTYWFVKINNEISIKDSVRFHDYQKFGIEAGIILCFTIVLFVIAYIVAENKVKTDL